MLELADLVHFAFLYQKRTVTMFRIRIYLSEPNPFSHLMRIPIQTDVGTAHRMHQSTT